mmetsp:Transcript_2358/g.5409  ORF Transcript_2358/g.5409 Transcript_2358/m.5409 type:complete len:96 (+) Transcript_2358:2254-2541(+)
MLEPLFPRHEKGEDVVDLGADCEEDGDDAKASQGHGVKELAVTSNKVKQMLGICLLVDSSLIVAKIAECLMVQLQVSVLDDSVLPFRQTFNPKLR